MKNSTVKKQKASAIDSGCDLRGAAYVNSAAKPFRTNGVSATAVLGSDLRSRKG